MVATDPPPVARVIAGRYLLGARRGTGVNAAVFDAYDEQLQRPVALKLVHPEHAADPVFARDFQRTMEAAAAVQHPNVVAVYDWGTDVWKGRGVLFVVVERFTGGTLRELLDRGRLLTASQALVVGLDACRGLDALHRAGLVHGDVRPSTLLFGEDRRLRVGSVGLGGLLARVMWSRAHELPNERAIYAAPEQSTGRAAVAPTDVYSLCLSLLESVTGRVPFVGETAVATLANRVGKLMPVSADFGPLASVLERAGRPIPEDRYTAGELGRALVQTAEKMPRPTPIHIVATGTAAEREAAEGHAADPSGQIARTLAGDAIGAARPDVADINDTATADPSQPTAVPPVPLDAVVMPVSAAGMASDAASDRDDAASIDERTFTRRRPSATVIAIVAILVASLVGGVVWFSSKAASSAVPDLVGLTEGEARNRVSSNGWEILVTSEASDGVEAGRVIRTQPPTGTTLRESETLQLVVSTGPAPRSLPDLVGLSLAEATDALVGQDLVLTQGEAVFDEVVPAGFVVSWMVPEQPALRIGDTVTPGTTVQVVLSVGPQPRVVPELQGLTETEVTAALQVVGLTLVRLPDEFSPNVAAGGAARQEPVAGEQLPRDAPVSVAFSKGPDLVPLPTLAGLDLAGMTAALQQEGFVLGTVTGDPAGAFAGASTGGLALAAGQLLPRGTAIDLTFT